MRPSAANKEQHAHAGNIRRRDRNGGLATRRQQGTKQPRYHHQVTEWLCTWANLAWSSRSTYNVTSKIWGKPVVSPGINPIQGTKTMGWRVDGVLVTNASNKRLHQFIDEQTDKDKRKVLQVQVKKIITLKLTKQKSSQHRHSSSGKATAYQTHTGTHCHSQQYQTFKGG